MKKELFTKGEKVLVNEVLNCLIPSDNGMPGAAEVGIVEYLLSLIHI